MTPTFEFAPFPPKLYSASDLLGGFNPKNPKTYAVMHDTRVYAQYMSQGGAATADYLTAMTRAIHDNGITQHLVDELDGKKVVAIMGGHTLSRKAPLYADTARLAATVTEAGFLIASGGGPAAMEAAHLGAAFAKRPDKLEAAIRYMAEHDVDQPTKPFYDGQKIDMDVAEALGKYLAPAFELTIEHGVNGGVGIPTWMYG